MRALERWIYGAHWRGWLAKAAATVVYMLAAQGFEDVTGWEVRHEAAAMWRGYYLFDTAKDIALNNDPWYDHALDTGIPWAISLGWEAVLPRPETAEEIAERLRSFPHPEPLECEVETCQP